MQKIGLIFIILILVYFLFCNSNGSGNCNNNEPMAPTEHGTYDNNYQRGLCNVGSFKRKPCMVGNCPLGSNITTREYCDIQCSQDPDNYDDCYGSCENIMENCI